MKSNARTQHFRAQTQLYPTGMFYYKTGNNRYIPDIYYAHTMRKSHSSLLRLRSGLPSDLLSFGHREAAHARLARGPSKVPQPGVDLVNMAAPPQVRARTRRTIGTAALKSGLLSTAVLMWNS